MNKPFFYILTGLLLWACMAEDPFPDHELPDLPELYEGVFILNEGNYMYSNASLSYYDIEEKRVYQDVFYNANGLPLGDVAQSMVIRNGLAYIVVNNSGRIYIMDVNSFEFAGKITGLMSPRHIHFLDDEKAYVTDLYAQSIAIVNPETGEITGSIDVTKEGGQFYQHSTEQMVSYKNLVFANSWSYDNSILVIDTTTDEWIDTIEVLIQPESMVSDKNDKLWVLTDGGFPGSPYGYEAPGLIRIDVASREIEKVYRFELGDSPRSLRINGSGDTLYFINRHVYRQPVASEASPEIFIESPYADNPFGGYRVIGVDPVTSELYVADAIDHVQPGIVYRFTPEALPVDTFPTGIIPGQIVFKSEPGTEN